MSNINFDNPWLLLIGVPLILLIIVPFFLAVRKGNRNGHNVTSCILHVLMALLISLSAAGMSVKSIMTETSVYVVADLSYSTNGELDAIDGYIENLYDNLPLNTKMGVVCFGATDSQTIHTKLGEKPKSVKASSAQIDDTSTDIVSALNFTSKIFKGDVIKRIVLITDAKNSDESDSNALKRAVDTLHASKIYVDAIYLDSNLAQDSKEVQVTDVEYSSHVYLGQEVSASVRVESNVNTRATLNVYRNDELLSSQPMDIGVGVRNVPVPLATEEEGEFDYTVSLSEIEADDSPFNNACSFHQTVSAEAKTLFITSSRDDEARAKEIYGDAYEKSVTLKYDTDTDIPYTVSALCQYDEIVLSNVNLTQIKNYEMFIESLEVVVSLLGKSLVGIGNLGLQNATEEAMLRLANMLPVRYGSPVKEEKLYTIVLDVSNSMNLNGKLALAKTAAKQLVDLLEDTDRVAVVAFHGEVEIVQKISSASDRVAIKESIDNLEDKHGTVLGGGLNGAKEVLKGYAKEMQTQIFMITDGNSNDDDFAAAEETAFELFTGYDVTTSILGIKIEEGSNIERKMIRIAEKNGKGKYWGVKDGTALNEDVFVDISNDFGEVLVDYNAYVNKVQLYDDVLEGIDDVSYIGGYVASREKANATTVLTTEHQRLNASSITVPIYTYWEYGNGKTASFLSSFSGEWTKKWNDIGLSKQFFQNVFTVNTPTEKVETPFVATVEKKSGGALLEIRPAQLKAGATVSVTLCHGDVRTEITNVAFDSNVYTCSFVLPSVGAYTAEITYTYKGESYTTAKPIHVSYLSEYDRFTTFDASPLYRMLGSNGTVSEDGDLEIVNDENEVGVQIIRLTVPLLSACVILFAIDIIVRKVKWADIKMIFRRRNKGGKR